MVRVGWAGADSQTTRPIISLTTATESCGEAIDTLLFEELLI